MRNLKILLGMLIIAVAMGSVFTSQGGNSVGMAFADETSKGTLVAASGSAIDWQDYSPGLSRAKTAGKPVFLYFHADWCGYCRQLKQTTFKDKRVQDYLDENYVSISVDTEKEGDIAREWGVRGLPTLWFLEADGTKISSLPGYVGPDQFLMVLKYIKTKSYDTMSFQEFVQKG
ncbi:MAG: thioredoxin fold domain-containing protein [Desulfobacterales bacterium]|nr:thioredoxin fold domain-containing protein [Desulfobacterales bacterium]